MHFRKIAIERRLAERRCISQPMEAHDATERKTKKTKTAECRSPTTPKLNEKELETDASKKKRN
jgi:hypothetical protein